MSTIINSYRQEGCGVFFHGLKPTIIRFGYGVLFVSRGLNYSSRAIPVNMVTFAAFELGVKVLTSF